MASVLALSTVACGSGDSGDSAKKDDAKTESGSEASSDVANKDKPLVSVSYTHLKKRFIRLTIK